MENQTNLEPCTSLWSWLKSITERAVIVEVKARAVRSAVTFATRLNPDKCVLQRITSGRGRTGTEAGSDDIAPVTPGALLCGFNTTST